MTNNTPELLALGIETDNDSGERNQIITVEGEHVASVTHDPVESTTNRLIACYNGYTEVSDALKWTLGLLETLNTHRKHKNIVKLALNEQGLKQWAKARAITTTPKTITPTPGQNRLGYNDEVYSRPPTHMTCQNCDDEDNLEGSVADCDSCGETTCDVCYEKFHDQCGKPIGLVPAEKRKVAP